MMYARFQGMSGEVVRESYGRVLIRLEGGALLWIIKGIPGLEIFEKTASRNRGRPRKHADNATKQREYRQRKSGKALRKYSKGTNR